MEQEKRDELIRCAKRVGAGSVAVTLLTVVCYHAHMDLASAIPLYLLLIVLQSLTGAFPSSVIIAALSAACLDFFFTEPLWSLRMANPLNALALLVFTFTALVISRLVSRVRTEARSSKLQKERLDRLYEFSHQLLALEPESAVGEKLLAPLRRLFGVTAIAIFDADTADVQTIGDSRHRLGDKTRDAYIGDRDMDFPGLPVSVRCLRVKGKVTGVIGFEGLHEKSETIGSLAALIAELFERRNAFRKAADAAAAAQTETYRSALLDALAHEFKTPLATILAAAGGIRAAGPLAPQQLEMTDTVEDEAERLGSLTARLLRIARLDGEDIRPRPEWIDLGSLIQVIVAPYIGRAPDRRIVLASSGQGTDVLADPELLRLTLNQLVENSCKYSQPGSTVRIEVEYQDDFVAVKVTNSGSSIPFNERSRVFERFYRGSEAKRSTSGSGLGLYVARKIALAHGGALDLAAEERPNEGVTFCLKIPVTKDELHHVGTAK